MSDETEAPEVVLEGERWPSRHVTFPSQDASSPAEAADPAEGRLRETGGQLYLPAGEATNRAAVVVAHGLGGQKPERELTYGHKLAKAGYVALVLDSFAARDLEDASDNWRALHVSTWSMVADAFAALRFLAEHPAVNPRAISVIGFSWGGMVTLLSAHEQVRRTFLEDSDLRFAGHVAYYGCSVPRLEDPTATGAPVLSMIGDKDRNISTERMRAICDDLRRGGAEVELKIFDGYHQWDGKDVEKRHNSVALADLHIVLTRDNRMVDERDGRQMDGPLTRGLSILRHLDWHGYDMLRDEELHRESDRLLFEQLDRVAERAGARRGDVERVPLGRIGEAAAEEE
ncbi:MAG: dienelactone hydrolase family protein [Tistlia sp.]|uniref:dienelactone hydrolase family protein n=1 Tax=Tistlia sp. TaxID=3057121 RepID=UPI0034A13B94